MTLYVGTSDLLFGQVTLKFGRGTLLLGLVTFLLGLVRQETLANFTESCRLIPGLGKSSDDEEEVILKRKLREKEN